MLQVQPMADFTAAIWTYHFGYDNKGWPSLERSAQMLNKTGNESIQVVGFKLLFNIMFMGLNYIC